MNKAQVKLELNESLTIDQVVYRVAEHPALPGVPYVQRGARGFVVQLKPQSALTDRYALKYFKIKYRVPELVEVSRLLRQYSAIPGLRAAERTLFTKQTHADLIQRFPALEYGVLMPWLPGQTWFDLVTRRDKLAQIESVRLAQHTARILASLEEKGLAHCDIAGANVMVDRKLYRVELVDIEEMYGAGLPRPVELPGGQEGYQHRQSPQNGQWQPAGDRFGGAILICEMLAWHHDALRGHSADEHFFAATELQTPDTPRYTLMYNFLQQEYGASVSELFAAAWRSPTLADCPPLTEWRTVLDSLDPAAYQPTPKALSTPPSSAPVRTSEVVTGRRMLTPTPSPLNPPPTQPANDPPPTQPAPSPLQSVQSIQVASVPSATKLCPHCGASNLFHAEFCVKCHFYLKGDQRPARATPSKLGTPVAGGPLTPTNPNAQRVAATHVTQEVIAARRMVGPGQSGQTVPTPDGLSGGGTQADGKWLIVGVIITAALLLMFLLAAVR